MRRETEARVLLAPRMQRRAGRCEETAARCACHGRGGRVLHRGAQPTRNARLTSSRYTLCRVGRSASRYRASARVCGCRREPGRVPRPSACSACAATSTTSSQYRGFAPPREPAFVTLAGDAAAAPRPEPRARRAPPGGLRLPAGAATRSIPRRRYPVLYLLHGFPAGRSRSWRRCRWGSSRTRSLTRHRAQPLILVMPFGSTGTFTDQEWVNGVRPRQRLGDVRRARPRAYDRRALPDDRRAPPAARSAGCRRAATARSTSPSIIRGSSRVVESWSGLPASRQDPRDLRHEAAAPARRTIRVVLLPRVAPRLRKLGTYFWFYSGSTDPLRRQNAAFARELAAAGSRTGTSRSSAGTTGRSGATRRARPTSPPRRGSRMRRVARSVVAAAPRARRRSSPRPAGSTSLRPARVAARARVVHDALAARRALAARQRLDRPLPGRVGRGRGAARAGRALGAASSGSTAGLLLGLGVGGWLYAAERRVDPRRPADPGARGLSRRRGGAGGRHPGRARGHRRRAARAAAQVSGPRSRLVLAWIVAGVGVLAAVDAIFPEHRRSLVTALDAAHVHGLSKALVVPLAAALVVTARSLARRKPARVAARDRAARAAARAPRRARLRRRRDRHGRRGRRAPRAPRRLPSARGPGLEAARAPARDARSSSCVVVVRARRRSG